MSRLGVFEVLYGFDVYCYFHHLYGMEICDAKLKYQSMQVCKYANMQILRDEKKKPQRNKDFLSLEKTKTPLSRG